MGLFPFCIPPLIIRKSGIIFGAAAVVLNHIWASFYLLVVEHQNTHAHKYTTVVFSIFNRRNFFRGAPLAIEAVAMPENFLLPVLLHPSLNF